MTASCRNPAVNRHFSISTNLDLPSFHVFVYRNWTSVVGTAKILTEREGENLSPYFHERKILVNHPRAFLYNRASPLIRTPQTYEDTISHLQHISYTRRTINLDSEEDKSQPAHDLVFQITGNRLVPHHTRSKMKVFSSDCTFDYSWEEVSTANWRKYCPWNDKSTHVIAVDTVSRHVDPETGIVRPPLLP
jgi:hypothetical protein